MTVPQQLYQDYRIPPKKSDHPQRNEAEDTYNAIVRDRLEVVEKIPKGRPDDRICGLLRDAEIELANARTRLSRALSDAEEATYKSLAHRIDRQKVRFGLTD